MQTLKLVIVTAAALGWLAGCGGGADDHPEPGPTTQAPDGTHAHDDGTIHADHADEGGHGQDEVSLGSAMIGDLRVELAQGHGAVVAGRESHLVVKLPYSDQGSTVVRAWIGTSDRSLSFAGRGAYAPSHDDYDVHATAPDPLPAGAMWWIEIEKPDGTTVVGSVAPITE